MNEWLNLAWTEMNKPLPVIGISLAVIFSFVFVLFRATSFGKKSIKKLTELGKRTETSVNKGLKEYETYKAELDNKFNEHIVAIDNRVNVLNEQFDFFENAIYGILESVPNAKVKNAVEKFKEQWLVKKAEIGLIVSNNVNDLLQERENKIALLENKIGELTRMFEEFKNDNANKETL